ncbi:hypothetical protein MARINOS108_20505 [Marinoscillum sp. 108]|nr:hypothetical protein MARINOS108_20505 [Marinoscillum sp. 108]
MFANWTFKDYCTFSAIFMWHTNMKRINFTLSIQKNLSHLIKWLNINDFNFFHIPPLLIL